jgi:hypothetical protein
MWALGWHKAMAAAELIGRYIKQLGVQKNPKKYDKLMFTSKKASNILVTMFKSIASIPFRKNQALTKENQIPSFSSSKFHSPFHNHHCSPHLTFTSDGFFKIPHHNRRDNTDFAFALFLPHNKLNGTLADPADRYNVTGGPFVIPDYRFGIYFSSPKGVVKLLWASKKLEHFTLQPVENKTYTRLAMSLQISLWTSNACSCIKNGIIVRNKKNKIKKMYIAHHRYYLKKNDVLCATFCLYFIFQFFVLFLFFFLYIQNLI